MPAKSWLLLCIRGTVFCRSDNVIPGIAINGFFFVRSVWWPAREAHKNTERLFLAHQLQQWFYCGNNNFPSKHLKEVIMGCRNFAGERYEWFVCAVAFLLVPAVVQFGCGEAVEEEEETAAEISVRPSDAMIADAVRRQLEASGQVAAHLITAEVDSGIVTLSGSIDNILSRDYAVKAVQSMRGVRGVVNDMRVVPVQRRDIDIRRNVLRALSDNPATGVLSIDVQVDGGEVILEGQVDSWGEKEMCEKVAKGVSGVREIENELAIVYEELRPDNEIKAEIEHRLAFDPYINAQSVNVKVKAGTVYLSGLVTTAADRANAIRKSKTAGVDTVISDSLLATGYMPDSIQRTSTNLVRTDIEIEAAIKDVIRQDERISDTGISVVVDDWTAVLGGIVSNLQEKRAAEEDARNTAGIIDVDNNIMVLAPETVTDAAISGQARKHLKWDPFVEHNEITMQVVNRKVFLYGMVDSYFERQHAEDIVSGVQGVAAVQNSLIVPDTWAWKSDRFVKDLLEREFRWNVYLDPQDIAANVDDGVVVLNGKVDGAGELAMAVEEAFDAGAKRVKSYLEVSGEEQELYAEYSYRDIYRWWR
ncbi:MAG: BON domain-containing protein [Chitinivibrionales bacterium]|nr:BON domain-containing protein [Chitinivibrionales bacterium]